MSGLLWVCLGGAAGSGARHLLSVWVWEATGQGFPYGTLTVNLVGSFLLCVVMHMGLEAQVLSPTARLALASGVLGGFTTYSTFSFETAVMLEGGAWGAALLNIGLTLVLGLAACFAGLHAARGFGGA